MAAPVLIFGATGGIGGVHRNHPFDVSGDLMELGRTPARANAACVVLSSNTSTGSAPGASTNESGASTLV